MGSDKRKVVVLGASDDPERYSYKAASRLAAAGHEVVPVNPRRPVVLGKPALSALSDVKGPVDTVTVYLAPQHSGPLARDLIELKPSRVVFNPGAENTELEGALNAAGVPTLRACTLVLLSTGQF